MKRQTLMLSLVVSLWLTGMAVGGAPMGTANVGQADFDALVTADGWECPASPTGTFGTFVTVTDLSLSIDTTGGPVLVIIQINHFKGGGNGFWLAPAIDGHTFDTDRQMVNIESGTTNVVNYSRVFMLAEGTHTFAVQMSCASAGVRVLRSWLTVYELPLMRR